MDPISYVIRAEYRRVSGRQSGAAVLAGYAGIRVTTFD
jgi:hypothetical protein